MRGFMPAAGAMGAIYRSLESAERFRIIMDNVGDAILLADADSHVVQDANAPAAALLDAQGRGLAGRPLETLLPEDVDMPLAVVSVGQMPEAVVESRVRGQAMEISMKALTIGGRRSLLVVLRRLPGRQRADASPLPGARDGLRLLDEAHRRISADLEAVVGVLARQAEALGDARTLDALGRSRRHIRGLLLAHARLCRVQGAGTQGRPGDRKIV